MKEGRQISTLRLSVGAVHQAWEWGYDADEYGEAVVPRPKRLKMPSPIARLARAPSWTEMDAAIGACYGLSRSQAELASPGTRAKVGASWVWRARLLTVMRCTGLRVTQVLRLRWDDIDDDMLVVRPELGKSRQEKVGHIIPLAPVLIDEIAGWGRREGWLVAPEKKMRRDLDPRPTRKAWETSGVHSRVWGGETKGQPHHAFRKGFKTGLARLGVEPYVRDLLVGHRLGLDGHYLDMFDEARAAVALIPAIERTDVATVLPHPLMVGER
jgi:integrase